MEPNRILPDLMASYNAIAYYIKEYDEINGGFGGAPKFPSPVIFKFLLNVHCGSRVLEGMTDKLATFTTNQLTELATKWKIKVPGEELEEQQKLELLRQKLVGEFSHCIRISERTLEMVTVSLVKMCSSGLYDHVDGGIHRYAVDNEFRVPHFEKMLYDQVQMISALLDVYTVTKNEYFLQKALHILRYCEEQLKHQEIPLFGSGQDADSFDSNKGMKVEGAYYVWTFKELKQIIPECNFGNFEEMFEISPNGNVPSEVPHFEGKNILRLKCGISDELPEEISQSLEDLKKYRQLHRTAPEVDPKCVTGWNAQLISCYARLFVVTHDETYRKKAVESAEFIFRSIYNEVDSRITRGYRMNIEGTSQDYAFLIHASLDLYDATFDPQWIEWAERLNDRLNNHLLHADGSLLMVGRETLGIFLPLKDDSDGAELCSNSIHASNSLRLAVLTQDAAYEGQAEKIFQSFIMQLEDIPPSVPAMLTVLFKTFIPPTVVYVIGELNDPRTKELIEWMQDEYNALPTFTIIACNEDDFSGYLSERNGRIRKLIERYSRTTEKPLIEIYHNYQFFLCAPHYEDIRRILE